MSGLWVKREAIIAHCLPSVLRKLLMSMTRPVAQESGRAWLCEAGDRHTQEAIEGLGTFQHGEVPNPWGDYSPNPVALESLDIGWRHVGVDGHYGRAHLRQGVQDWTIVAPRLLERA